MEIFKSSKQNKPIKNSYAKTKISNLEKTTDQLYAQIYYICKADNY